MIGRVFYFFRTTKTSTRFGRFLPSVAKGGDSASGCLHVSAAVIACIVGKISQITGRRHCPTLKLLQAVRLERIFHIVVAIKLRKSGDRSW